MTFWQDASPIILASASAARLQLLKSAGLEVRVEPAEIDERRLEESREHDEADARTIALILAKAKGAAVAARFPGAWIVAADQTLALGSLRFHKPSGKQEAAMQLRALAGKTHHLHSAVCCFRNGACVFEHAETAAMTMRPFSDAFLADYMANAGPSVTQSVGAYQVEGPGIHLFEAIDGNHSTILGLPLLPLLAFLRSAGALAS